jgi:hypothetical protein
MKRERVIVGVALVFAGLLPLARATAASPAGDRSSLAPEEGGFRLDVEVGAVTTGVNKVRIPGDGGTRFSLTEDLETPARLFWRARLEYARSEHHVFSLLLAPLTLEAEGRPEKDIAFQGEVFPAGAELKTRYTFNSYRLTYRYDFAPRGPWLFGLGFTAKIRDAVVRLSGSGCEVEKSNVGFVPLINFRVRRALGDRLAISLAGDALAAPQGRAEDVAAMLHLRASTAVEVRLGYRLLEGGVDNDEVYNFSLFHYFLVGAIISF